MKPSIRFAFAICLWAVVFSVRKVVVIGIVVLLHEGAHVLACKALGVRVMEMKALPWGITATAPLMHDPLSQFVVSVSGPMFNFFLLMFTPAVEAIFSESVSEVYALANLADGLLNLIPALPLDGGIILKSFLCSAFGFVRGFVYMMRITAAVGIVLMVFGLQMFAVTGSNISYLVAGLFIVFNLRHERQLVMCIRKRILTGEIRSGPSVRRIKVPEDSHAVRLVDFVSPAHTIVFVVVKEGETVGSVGQNRIIDCVLKNTMITVGECIEKF